MAGFTNDANLKEIVFCDNVDFSGNATPSATMQLDGQLLIGSSVDPRIAPALLSAGSGISIVNGHNSITISASGGATTVQTLTGNSGGAISPTAGNINTLGTGSITIAGAGSTLTTQLTGLTNHNVLVGAGTATITNVAPSATSGIPLISQGAAVDPIFGTALVAGGGTGAVTFNTNGVVISNTTGTGVLAAVSLTAGQVVIGSATTPAAANLTPGNGVSIVNGNNSITISATSGGFTWVNQTADLNPLVKQTAYQANKAGTAAALTLPTGGTFGDTIRIQGKGATGWVLNAGAGQTIQFLASATSVAGSLASTNANDYVEVVCSSTTTTWFVTDAGGNLTVA